MANTTTQTPWIVLDRSAAVAGVTSVNDKSGVVKLDNTDALAMGAALSVNGNLPDANGNIDITTGDEAPVLYIGEIMHVQSAVGKTPIGSLPADGSLYLRSSYPDLWKAITDGTLYVVTDTEWNAGAFDAFSYGDGDATTGTTFRVPDMTNRIQNLDLKKLIKEDLNSLTADSSGWWYQNIPADATTDLHYPVAGVCGTLIVHGNGTGDNGDGCSQSYYCANSDDIYNRFWTGPVGTTGGAWSPWVLEGSVFGDMSVDNISITEKGYFKTTVPFGDANYNQTFNYMDNNGLERWAIGPYKGNFIINAYDENANSVTALTIDNAGVTKAGGSVTTVGNFAGKAIALFGESDDMTIKPNPNKAGSYYAGHVGASYAVFYPDGISSPGLYVRNGDNTAYTTTWTTVDDGKGGTLWTTPTATSTGVGYMSVPTGDYGSQWSNAFLKCKAVDAPAGKGAYQPLCAIYGSTDGLGYNSSIGFGKYTDGASHFGKAAIVVGTQDIQSNGQIGSNQAWIFGESSTYNQLTCPGAVVTPAGQLTSMEEVHAFYLARIESLEARLAVLEGTVVA